MSLDGQKIDIPTEIPQEYVEQAREKERLAKERDEYEKANKVKKKIKHIETFECFVNKDDVVCNEQITTEDENEMKNIIPFGHNIINHFSKIIRSEI